MKNFVNGYSKPGFISRNPDNTILKSWELHLTNQAGLVETHQRDILRKKTWGRRLKQKLQGYRILFTLNYDRYSNLDNTNKIIDIFDTSDLGNPLYIVPRIDVPERTIQVLNDTSELNIGIMRGAIKAPGNRLIILKFISVEVFMSLQLIDPNNVINLIDEF